MFGFLFIEDLSRIKRKTFALRFEVIFFLTYQEDEHVVGDVPDADTEPLRPHSEEEEEESREDHES